jgi:phenylacetate-CoA ligase
VRRAYIGRIGASVSAILWLASRIQDKAATIVSRSMSNVRPSMERESVWPIIVGYATRPILKLGYPKLMTFDFLQKTQWWPENRLKELQLDGLKQLVNWARTKCPYYHCFPKVNSLEDLEGLPILSKRIIHERFNDLIARDARLPLTKVSTGGTCSPITLMRDLSFEAARYAGYRRFRSWVNPILERRQAKICYLWTRAEIGSEPRQSPHALYLPVEGLNSRDDSVKYLKMIKHFRPDNLRGYTLPLVTLAHYELWERINPQIGSISCNCETLLIEHRRLLEEAFRCHVFNFYGSQDLGSMAQDCKKHEGLHSNAERYIIETTRDGRLLFTDLLSYGMPLIRYENQDMGKLAGVKCSCGRGLPLMEEVIGRVLSFVITKKQTWISIASLRDEMYKVSYFRELVEKFQLCQEEPGKIVLLIKPWKKDEVPDLKALARIWPNDDLDIEVKIVDSILISRTGKELALVTKFSPPCLDNK